MKYFEAESTEGDTRVKLIGPVAFGGPQYSEPVGTLKRKYYTLLVERRTSEGFKMLGFASVTGLPLGIQKETVELAATRLAKLLDWPVTRNSFTDAKPFARNVTPVWVTEGSDLPYAESK